MVTLYYTLKNEFCQYSKNGLRKRKAPEEMVLPGVRGFLAEAD
jgi:hypothetical protein